MKKRLLIVGLFAVLLSSCGQEVEDGLTTISIGYRYVDSGSMYATRSEIVHEIDEALSAIMPSTVPLTLHGESASFSFVSGEDITLPFGHYDVIGASSQTRTFVVGQSAWVSPEPLVEICDAIDVTYGKYKYSVNASIGSFAIAWNNTIVESVSYISASGQHETLPSFRYEDTSVCFVTGELTEETLIIILHPWKDKPFEERSFSLSTSEDGNGIYCENGKWYALSPIVISAESGAIDFQCGTWKAGGNYY